MLALFGVEIHEFAFGWFSAEIFDDLLEFGMLYVAGVFIFRKNMSL